LANEHGVRTRLAARNPAVLLHATTGDQWLSELHRHILGIDDCIRCRMQDIKAPVFGCSTTAVATDSDETIPDAALPFLSAASGLMLATAMQKLQSGELSNGRINNWRLDFDSEHRMAGGSIRKCQEDCSQTLSPALRRKI